MPPHHSLLREVLKHIPWGVFDRLVDRHSGDKHVRRLSMRQQFLALLYGQLSGCVSLREIELQVSSQKPLLYHAGLKPFARSTLSDANASRPSAVFEGLFAALAGRLSRTQRRHAQSINREVIRLMDATYLPSGHKLHCLYDPDKDCPLDPCLTLTRINDIVVAKTLTIEPGATYVFDLGYYDYGFWARLEQAGCRFVTRLKVNTPLREAQEGPPSSDPSLLSERTGYLPARLSHSRTNPFTRPVREIVVRIDSGKTLRLVTNDLTSPATEIAALYKRRWQIELLFRWLKQHLKIRHFVGKSDNGVRIQILVALIAYVLLRLVKATQSLIASPLSFTRLVRTSLLQPKTPQTLSKPTHPPPQKTSQQLTLQFIIN